MTGSRPFRKNRRGTRPAGGPAMSAGTPAEGLPDGAEPGTTPGEGLPAVRRGERAGRRLPLPRGRLLAADGVRKAGRGARIGLATATERLIEHAPRIPVRDLATLRSQFPGLDAEQLADKLIAGATKGSATVGAGVGAAAALPVPPAMTVELAAETLAVAAVEIKLIAELHEVYGVRAPGNAAQRAHAYMGAWSNRRGVDVLKAGGISAAMGSQLKKDLRLRLLKRTVRNLPTLAPFLVGAAIGAVTNRRDTRRLADEIRADLRSRAVPWAGLGPADSPRPVVLPPSLEAPARRPVRRLQLPGVRRAAQPEPDEQT